jgi:2-methylisocitrate lyase-like PEP mutase family enzyme
MSDPAPTGSAALAERLRALHVPGDPLVVVNAWDAASARVVAGVHGCRAIATASWAIAAAHGLPDHETIDRDTMLAAVARIVAAVPDLPVTADLEAGYGATPAEVGQTVEAAARLGVVGLNLEDQGRPIEEAAGRVAAARAAAERAEVPLVINARVDPWSGEERVTEAAARGRAYVAAGADCVFVIGATDHGEIAQLVELIGAPVSVLARPGASVAELAALGVARVSFGPGPQGAAMAALRDAAVGLLGGGEVPAAFAFRPPA